SVSNKEGRPSQPVTTTPRTEPLVSYLHDKSACQDIRPQPPLSTGGGRKEGAGK
ncbi:hypothetical protein Pcinc_038189, partial [Petrolisthes cinctipes]